MTGPDSAEIEAAINDPDKVTIREAAKALGLPWSTVQGWVSRKRIKKYKRGISQTVFVSLAEIREKAAIRPVDDDEGEGEELP